MRSKEAFAYSRSAGCFCSVAAELFSALPPGDAATGRSLSRRKGHGASCPLLLVGKAQAVESRHDNRRSKSWTLQRHMPCSRKSRKRGTFGCLKRSSAAARAGSGLGLSHGPFQLQIG
jgi:hypothetical protein